MNMATAPAREAREAYKKFLTQQRKFLGKLDALNDEDFVEAVQILLRTGRSQSVIAASLGVNPATISRWAIGGKLPKKAIVREAYLSAMERAMAGLIADVAA